MDTVRLPARFFALVAALTVLVVVGVGSRGDAVHASTPPAEIYFTFVDGLETDCGNPMVPPVAQSQFNIIPINGQVPDTMVACVWAKGVKTGIGGAAGFSIDMTYNNNIAAVASFVPNDTWLESTGRSLTCPAPSIGPAPGAPPGVYRLVVQCVSFGQSPPGPAGGGLLGVLTLAPNQTGLYGISNLDHTDSFLVRVTSSTDVEIATTATDGKAAHCTLRGCSRGR